MLLLCNVFATYLPFEKDNKDFSLYVNFDDNTRPVKNQARQSKTFFAQLEQRKIFLIRRSRYQFYACFESLPILLKDFFFLLGYPGFVPLLFITRSLYVRPLTIFRFLRKYATFSENPFSVVRLRLFHVLFDYHRKKICSLQITSNFIPLIRKLH